MQSPLICKCGMSFLATNSARCPACHHPGPFGRGRSAFEAKKDLYPEPVRTRLTVGLQWLGATVAGSIAAVFLVDVLG